MPTAKAALLGQRVLRQPFHWRAHAGSPAREIRTQGHGPVDREPRSPACPVDTDWSLLPPDESRRAFRSSVSVPDATVVTAHTACGQALRSALCLCCYAIDSGHQPLKQILVIRHFTIKETHSQRSDTASWRVRSQTPGHARAHGKPQLPAADPMTLRQEGQRLPGGCT